MALQSQLNQNPTSIAPAAALGLGASLHLRAWHKRRDRRALESWPASTLPASWLASEPSSSPRISYAIELLPEPRLIGRITLREMEGRAARLGIYLHPSYVGQGYGTAALRLFLRSTFEAGDLAAIRLDVAIDNRRAIRCYEKCGFRVVGAVERGDMRLWEMECSR